MPQNTPVVVNFPNGSVVGIEDGATIHEVPLIAVATWFAILDTESLKDTSTHRQTIIDSSCAEQAYLILEVDGRLTWLDESDIAYVTIPEGPHA